MKSITAKKNQNPILTANEFLKIKDIRNDLLYTTDGYIKTFLQVYPQNTTLKTYNEQANIALNLASNFSTETTAFKIFITSRPVDVSKMTDYQIKLMNNETDPQIQHLLSQRINGLNNLANSGIALEEEIYIEIWTKDQEGAENELYSRKSRIAQELASAGFNYNDVSEKQLQQLVDTYNNPESSTQDSQDYLNINYYMNG